MQSSPDNALTPASATFLKDFSWQNLLEGALPHLIDFGVKALAALAILMIGLFLAGRLKTIIRTTLLKSKQVDPIVAGFLASFSYYAALAAIVIAVIGIFGIPTTSFAALFGAAGLAVGFALQGTLGHVASGVMLLIFRPFKLGDYISTGGFEGTIRDINLFFSELATLDNRKIIIPNGLVWDNAIVNFAAYGKRRMDLIFTISYSDDIDKAQAVVRRVCEENAHVLQDPAPIAEVDSLGDFSVNIICRIWVDASEYLDAKWGVTKQVKLAFDHEGITIPFPTAIEYQGELLQEHKS